MARFRSNKRAKELQRKAKHEAKEARKKERQEKSASGEDDDIDWSQAVGFEPAAGSTPEGEESVEDADGDADDLDDDARNAEEESKA